MLRQRLYTSQYSFVDKLKSRGYKSLKIHCHNMPDESHSSVAPGAISRGLRYVFDHWDPSKGK